MLQRFKLRLGDGTVLLVDHDGLGTWLVDGKAAVQAGKSRNWIPLRQFLARERAASARRARTEAAAWAALPADSPPGRRGDGLPLVPPPPPAVAETPSPALTPPPREGGLPLTPPPPPPDEAPLPDVMPSPTEDELPLVLPEPVQEAYAPAQFTAPGDEDWRDVVLEPPTQDLSVPSPVIEPEAALPAAARPDESPSSNDVPLAPEHDPPVKIIVGEPRVMQTAAVKPPSVGHEARPESPLEEDLIPGPAGAVTTLERPYSSPEPVVTEATVPGHAGEPHEVQALAEDLVSSEAVPVPVSDLPVIPFKPLEDDVPVRPLEPGSTGAVAAHQGNPIAALDAGGPLSDGLLQDGRATAALRFVASFGAFLSRCLDPVNRLERGLPPFPVEMADEGGADRRVPRGAPMAAPDPAQEISQIRPLAEEPSFAAEHDAGLPKESDGYPAIRLKPLDEDETPLWDPSRRQRLLARARQWVEKPAAWAARLADRDRPGTAAEPEMLRAAEPGPWKALQAPPAIVELPVLRFATAQEPAVAADVYEGDEGEGVVPVGWLWTKRLALGATLLAGATLGALTFETWSPKAAEIGETTLSEIDGRVRSHHLAGQRQEAVAEVADGLPQLDPETIGLVMAASPTGLLDAAGVFELACDATDRGVSGLTASDARELEALQQRLLDALLPSERERLREFDLARARGAVFPIDGKQALLAYARGTRRLSPANQERLQLLLGRTIAAALALPGPAMSGDAAPR